MQLKTSFFVALLLALSSNLWAAERVVFLTALDAKPPLLTKWENRVRDTFKHSPYTVEVIHRAKEEQLRETLLSPDVAAVFWMSHAAPTAKLKPGLAASSTIRDIDGNEVKNLFTQVAPQVRFVAIVGCEAEGIVQDFEKKSYFRPDLEVYAFDHDVIAILGLNRGLREAASKDWFKNPTTASASSAASQTIHIHRSHSTTPGFTRVEMGDAVLAILPPGDAELDVTVPTLILEHSDDLNIHVVSERAVPLKNPRDLGEYEITLEGQKHWTLFALPNGEPIGANSQLLRFNP